MNRQPDHQFHPLLKSWLIMSFVGVIFSMILLFSCALPVLGMGGLTQDYLWLSTISVHSDIFYNLNFWFLIAPVFTLMRLSKKEDYLELMKNESFKRTRRTLIISTTSGFVIWLGGFIITYFGPLFLF